MDERRLPAVEREIAAIRAEDGRVRVTGRVIDVAEGRLVLDDGTGSVQVSVVAPEWMKAGSVVRVFGKVMPAEHGVELEGEFVQDMGKLDVELMKKVREKERGS